MNIRGIKSKIRDIVNIAEEENMDVMVFTETKLERDEKKEIEVYKQFNFQHSEFSPISVNKIMGFY